MPSGIAVGDEVYVPVERTKGATRLPHALAKGRVTGSTDRTLTVDMPYGIGTVNVAASLVHVEVGICLVRVGDFDTESTLLDPLAKSILQYLRLLLPDDQLQTFSVRTKREFYEVYKRAAAVHSHFVLVGHGDGKNLLFSLGETMSGDEMAAELSKRCSSARTFINLCCENGRADFGRPFSESSICKDLVAPLGPLHGAVGSQFLQTLFGYHFLEGRTLKVAFKKAREQVPGGAAFRIWRNGAFEGRPA